MAKINSNYNNLRENYLFVEIAKRTAAYQKTHPEARVIKLGIGDVTRPIAAVAADDTETKADVVDIHFAGVEPQLPNYLYARQMGINSAKLIWEAPNSNHIAA